MHRVSEVVNSSSVCLVHFEYTNVYRMAGNFCWVLIFVIFVVDLAVTKISISLLSSEHGAHGSCQECMLVQVARTYHLATTSLSRGRFLSSLKKVELTCITLPIIG